MTARRTRATHGVVAAIASGLLVSGCASSHLATSTARDGVGVDPTAGTAPTSSLPTSTTPSPSPRSTSSGASAKDFAAIRRLMAARARAVVADDGKTFMATVDTGRPDFVAAQQVVFENLQDLPVTAMRYDVGNAGLTDAAGITGGPLLTPPVVEHVYFAETDRRPVANQVVDTFVKRAGHWRLAADSIDADASGGATARPWAGPRLDVVVRGPLIVVADASWPGRASVVADTVESDLAFDAGILDVKVDDHLMVDATSSGSVSKFDNAESAGAVTFTVFAEKHFEFTGLAGLRIKLNPDYISQMLADPTLLRHELTHFLRYRYAGLNPKWLTEGLAEYVSHQPAGLPSEYMTPESYDRLLNRSQVITVSGLFGMDPSTDYPLAMACVTFLVNHGGISKVEDLMAAYAEHRESPYGDQFTGHLLGRLYGLSPADVAHGAFDLLQALR